MQALGLALTLDACLTDHWLREHDSRILRRALSLSRYEREFIVTQEIIAAFNEQFELLPLMTYLYMVDSASVAEVRLVCQQLGLAYDQRTEAFLALALKDRFLRAEIDRSLSKPEQSEYFDVSGSFKYSSMVTLRDAEIEQIQDRLVELFSLIEVHNKSAGQLEDPGAQPYFFGLVVSGRPEYDGRAGRPKNKPKGASQA